jgi:chromosome segregation ATPase
LLTADITKDEEKSLNNEIMLLKRKIREAESSGNIEFKLEQCEERKDELDEEIEKIKKNKEPIEAEFTKVKEELDKKNEHITGLKGVLSFLSSNLQLIRARRPKRKIATTRSMNLGRNKRKSDLTNFSKILPKLNKKVKKFGMTIIKSKMTSGSRNSSLTSSNGKLV